MTVLLDTGPIVSLADVHEPRRDALLEILRTEPGPLVVPAPATAEIDYLLGRRFGHAARLAFLRDLAAGRFTVACLEREDHADVVELEQRYQDLGLGLVDYALVVLAGRLGTTRLATYDEPHFRAVTTSRGDAFTILPADA